MTAVLNFIFFMLIAGFISYTFLVLIWYIVTAVTAMRDMKKSEGIHETDHTRTGCRPMTYLRFRFSFQATTKKYLWKER
ncbi:hypothetical protein [Sinobaca sp. H24]|uniref:hypothetical protein n=1 Tax=Sinobaca sp. H24 TaxID=2923376 RepID=UPI00207A8FE2|nr:hypothetical protein [Sinobaca sp. H24]